MKRVLFQAYPATIITILLLFPVSPALATRLNYTFQVTNLTGALAEQEFFGSLSFEDNFPIGENPKLTRRQSSPVPFPFEFDGQLDFDFHFLGYDYNELDEEFDNAALYVKSGNIIRIFYNNEQYSDSFAGTAFSFQFTGSTGISGSAPFQYWFDGGSGSYAEARGVGDIIISKDGVVVSQIISPELPDRSEDGWWWFDDVDGNRWYDPTTTYGFDYEMVEDSLFTNILGLPVNLDADETFSIAVGDVLLGDFTSQDTVDFSDYSDLLGDLLVAGSDGKLGVAKFSIAGIDSPIDPDDPLAFPVQLAFDTSSASFKMRSFEREEDVEPGNPIPEPSAILGLCGFSIMGLLKRRALR